VVSGKGVPIIYHFEDLDKFIRAQMSSGPSQIIVQNVGKEIFKQALIDFYKQFKGDDEHLRLNNQFRFVTAVPS
ncbi:MAG: hypothetical protein ACR2PH_00765, partial [Desulfobulbia bacterium]